MDQVLTKTENEKFCKDCGSLIHTKAEICPKCGIRQASDLNSFNTVAPNGKSKLAAGLLALFVGGFGIHKFYLGRVGQGILYLLLFWTFIPALIGFIEGVIYLTMSDNAFVEKYGRV